MLSKSVIASVIMFMSGAVSFSLNYKYFLNSLLSLELAGLSLLFLLVSALSMKKVMIFSIFYMIMIVAEGSLGLAMLVSMSFNQSNNFMKSTNSLVC